MKLRGKSNFSDPTFLRALDEAWEKEPSPLLPFLQREVETSASLPPNAQRAHLQALAKEERQRSLYVRVRGRLHVRDMTVRDVQTMVGITKRQLTDWESRWVKSWAQARHNEGWRRFSIADVINLAIIKTIKTMGVPINRLGQAFTDWIQQAHIVDGLIVPFSLGRQVYLAFELRASGLGFYWDDAHANGIQRLNGAVSPVICLPLKDIFKNVLNGIKREDFATRRSKDGIWSFRVGNQWFDFKRWAHSFEPKQNIAAGMKA